MHSSMPDIPDLLKCLRVDNTEMQINATACLQHLTYQNEENKEILRKCNGIPLLVSLFKMTDSHCQVNVAGVIRNLSHGPNLEIKESLESYGVVEIIERFIENHHHFDRRFIEVLVAVLCNLSSCPAFHAILSNFALIKITQNILMPFIGLRFDPSANRVVLYKISDLSFQYTTFLEHMTAFLKNLSGGPRLVREQMRVCDGLMDSIIAIIQHGMDNENADCKIVENCICVVRNLSYSLQEAYDPKERRPLINKLDNSTSFTNAPRHADIRCLDLLYTTDMIDLMLEVINECRNHSSVEAAVGTIQNLTASKWYLSEEFRVNFRKKKGLPPLIMLLLNGPNKIVYVTSATLRNLSENIRNLELIGSHCLIHMVKCLPSPGNVILKRKIGLVPNQIANKDQKMKDVADSDEEEQLTIGTIYSVILLIYFLLTRRSNLCEVFVQVRGYKNCIFLLKSDVFYKQNMQQRHPKHHNAQYQNVERIPILASLILQLLWSQPKLRQYFKQEKLTSEDFCVPGIIDKMKLGFTSSSGSKGRNAQDGVYYGKPYLKARSKTLVPFVSKSGQLPPTIIVTSDSMDENEAFALQKPSKTNQASDNQRSDDRLQLSRQTK